MRKSLFRRVHQTCRWPKNTDQSGQAIVEYVLLLVIGIALLLGLSAKFFKPAKNWADVYMGSYTQCLLDAGELPSIAGGTPVDCQNSAIDGGTWGSGSSASTKSSSDDGSSGSDSSGKSGKSSSSSSSRSRHSGHESHRTGSHSVQSASNDFGNLKDANSKNGTEGPAGNGNKTRSKTNQDRFRDSNSSIVDSVSGRGGRIRAVGISGLLPAEKPETPGVEERAAKQFHDDDEHMKPKKSLIKPPDRSLASMHDKGEDGFSFGSLFRIGVIVMIIVGILYLVSTQLNSVFKSMDK